MTVWEQDTREWYVHRDGDGFTLSRRLPVRWDVEARAVLPDLGRRRLAHAIRQDMWRMLQDVRGFAPVVEVVRRDGQCHVRAGGAVNGPVAPQLSARVAELLADPAKRAAWTRAAQHRRAA